MGKLVAKMYLCVNICALIRTSVDYEDSQSTVESRGVVALFSHTPSAHVAPRLDNKGVIFGFLFVTLSRAERFAV